jgi:hypothetical protein
VGFYLQNDYASSFLSSAYDESEAWSIRCAIDFDFTKVSAEPKLHQAVASSEAPAMANWFSI